MTTENNTTEPKEQTCINCVDYYDNGYTVNPYCAFHLHDIQNSDTETCDDFEEGN